MSSIHLMHEAAAKCATSKKGHTEPMWEEHRDYQPPPPQGIDRRRAPHDWVPRWPRPRGFLGSDRLPPRLDRGRDRGVAPHHPARISLAEGDS